MGAAARTARWRSRPTPSALTAARSGYLGDGKESSSYTYDGDKLDARGAAGTGVADDAVPGDVPAFPGTTPPDQQAPSSGGSRAAAAAAARPRSRSAATSARPSPLGRRLAERRLLLDGHPRRRRRPARRAPTVASLRARRRARPSSRCSSTTGFRVGDAITIGAAPSIDSGDDHERRRRHAHARRRRRTSRTSPASRSSAPAARSHYVDLELPQDVCARRAACSGFGISSEPSLTSAQAPFATGLSSSGRLTSAARTSAFYGAAARSRGRRRSAPTSTRCSLARRAIRSSPRSIRARA